MYWRLALQETKAPRIYSQAMFSGIRLPNFNMSCRVDPKNIHAFMHSCFVGTRFSKSHRKLVEKRTTYLIRTVFGSVKARSACDHMLAA